VALPTSKDQGSSCFWEVSFCRGSSAKNIPLIFIYIKNIYIGYVKVKREREISSEQILPPYRFNGPSRTCIYQEKRFDQKFNQQNMNYLS
jgi:hypothetical protein